MWVDGKWSWESSKTMARAGFAAEKADKEHQEWEKSHKEEKDADAKWASTPKDGSNISRPIPEGEENKEDFLRLKFNYEVEELRKKERKLEKKRDRKQFGFFKSTITDFFSDRD